MRFIITICRQSYESRSITVMNLFLAKIMYIIYIPIMHGSKTIPIITAGYKQKLKICRYINVQIRLFSFFY